MSGRRGQSILEYTIIIGIVTVVFFYMGTGVKRGVQSLVKVTADQVGNQQDADQDFNDAQSGYMVSSDTTVQENNSKVVGEQGYTAASGNPVYVSSVTLNDYSDTVTNSYTNAGFTPSSE